jgi:hypothetical protein
VQALVTGLSLDCAYCFGPGLGFGAGSCDGDTRFERYIGDFGDGCHCDVSFRVGCKFDVRLRLRWE